MSDNKNKPAFPINYASTPMGDIYNSHGDGFGGLSKRELFASMAMQGFAANTHGWEELTPEHMAKLSVQHADALLAELEK